MPRPIPGALTWADLANDVALALSLESVLRQWNASPGPCRLTRLGKAVTLQWRRAVDPNQVMTEGDWI